MHTQEVHDPDDALVNVAAGIEAKGSLSLLSPFSAKSTYHSSIDSSKIRLRYSLRCLLYPQLTLLSTE